MISGSRTSSWRCWRRRATSSPTVTPEIKAVAGGPKLVNLTFNIDEGPQVKIRKLDFDGNKAFGDGTLDRQMKNNKGTWMFSFITGRGTYQEAKFEEDAEKLVGYYRDHGYIAARVGEPELKVLEDSTDRRTRWVKLRIPSARASATGSATSRSTATRW